MAQTLGSRIVTHRKQLKLTQEQLAERLGVTPQAVSKWENDQSCPDITMLPRLADIFGITVDSLLGVEDKNTPPAQEPVSESPVVTVQSGNWEITYNKGRRFSLGLAVLVILVGGLLLLRQVMALDVSLWNILWPSVLIVVGVFRALPKFNLCVGLAGIYCLLNNLKLLPFSLGSELVFPIILVLLGVGLLIDALRSPKEPRFQVQRNGVPIPGNAKPGNSLELSEDGFVWNASFGEGKQTIDLPLLNEGCVNTSFGDFVLDLTGVEAASTNCRVSANCSFGELEIRVPAKFAVSLTDSTSFASIDHHGHHAAEPEGTIYLDAHVSFGEMSVRYV